MFLPKMVILLKVLNDRALNTATMVMRVAVIKMALPRDILYSSIMKVMGISLNEMVEVSEAKNTSRKNSKAQTYPPDTEALYLKLPGFRRMKPILTDTATRL